MYSASNESEHISVPLDMVLQRLKNRVNKTPQIFEDWYAVVGPSVKAYTKPVEYKNGTMLVNVSNSVLYSELSIFLKNHILTAMRKKSRQDTIKDIRFKIGEV